jgi:hypothetical protein
MNRRTFALLTAVLTFSVGVVLARLSLPNLFKTPPPVITVEIVKQRRRREILCRSRALLRSLLPPNSAHKPSVRRMRERSQLNGRPRLVYFSRLAIPSTMALGCIAAISSGFSTNRQRHGARSEAQFQDLRFFSSVSSRSRETPSTLRA